MNKVQRSFLVAGAALSSASVFAVGPDFATITAAVDWSTVGLGIVAIAALKAVPMVVSVGSKMVLRAIGR